MADPFPHSGEISGPARILVVEDEESIRDVVSTALRHGGHKVTVASDGRKGLELGLEQTFDLIVLDIMLPGMDGYEICCELRENGRDCPVLFLTAKDKADDRIRGFVSGGDDYMAKPFSVDELVLRVQAILRRSGRVDEGEVLRVGDLTLEPAGYEVRRAGELIELSPTEFRLLHYLMVNKGVVVSKTQILVSVWDYDFDGNENVVSLYVGYLRRKIDDGRLPLIHTQRGAGYVLRDGSR